MSLHHAHLHFAHLRVGDCDIAVPALAIERAVALPAAGMTPLPRRAGALSGLVDVDGSAVPVVALDRWVPVGPAGDGPEARIVVLRAGAARIALRVDALVGVVRVDLASVRTVCHAVDHAELFEAIVPATSARPLLCILEVERLMALTAAWCAQAEIAPAVGSAAANARRAAASGFALFTVGDRLWAVPTAAIARLVPAPRAELRWPGRQVCGIGAWQARKLPLVDLGANGSDNGDARPWMAVMVQGPLAIGLVVSRCERMIELAVAPRTAAPCRDIPTAAPCGDFATTSSYDAICAGTTIVPGLGAVSILDVDNLFRAVPEATISRAVEPMAAHGQPAQTSARTPSSAWGDDDDTHYLVFEADRRYASPVAGVLGVAALPPAAILDLNAGRRATMDWRGQTFGVVAMPSLDGGAMPSLDAGAVPSLDGGRPESDVRVAVILQGAHAGQAHSAVAVRSLRDWLSAKVARRSGMQRRDVGHLSMITPPGGQRSGSLVVVDLAQMAHLLA